MQRKSELRKKFLDQRRLLPIDVTSQKSLDISRQLLSAVDWSEVHSMHCFLPIQNDNEPDLRSVITFALERGITVYTSNPSGKTEKQVRLLDDTALQQRVRQYSLSDEEQFDLVIVPMLAYDPMTRHRLGFGGGFYDRMLSRQESAKKIGVCFLDFSHTLPAESHDVALDTIIVA